MPEFKNRYKKPPSNFGNAKKIKSHLTREQQDKRKKRRTKDFERNRIFSNSSIKEETKKKLSEWRMEKEQKKKQQKLQKKPPFIVGIVRHTYYSPIANKNLVKKSSKIITKSTEQTTAKTKNRNVEKQKATATSNAKKSPANAYCIKSDTSKRKSFAPIEHKFNPPVGLSKIYKFGEDNFKNEKIPAHDNSTENVIPVSSPNELPTKDATKLTKKSNTPVEKKKNIIEYFKHLLYTEKNKLETLCKHWTKIQSQNDIQEEIRCRINQAVGQTTLLMDKKFTRFHGLLSLYEKNSTDMLITSADLHGFWDLMYIEVKDCNSRFKKLEDLRVNYWQEEQSSFTNSAKKGTDAKKQAMSVKQSLSQGSISSDNKKRKMTKMRENKEKPEQLLSHCQSASTGININHKFITPISDETIKIIKKDFVSRGKCCKSLLNTFAKNNMYTSTPFDSIKSKNLNTNASLVTMKIGQLYNKSTMEIDSHISPVKQTPKRSIIEKSGTLRRSLRIKLARDAGSNFLSIPSSLEISQNSQTLLKTSFEFEKLSVHEMSRSIRKRLNYEASNSLISTSTVIEKTLQDKDKTLKWASYNNFHSLIETPVSTGIKNKKSS